MIIDKVIWGNPVAGYPSIIVSILFLGGVQLIESECLGNILVEYTLKPNVAHVI